MWLLWLAQMFLFFGMTPCFVALTTSADDEPPGRAYLLDVSDRPEFELKMLSPFH